MTRKIDIDSAPVTHGTAYPPPFDTPCLDRMRQRLGDAAKLTQFGVNLTRLAPGTWSSQRHWHTFEDEFIYIVSGEVVLVTDSGEELLRAGECAGFKAGVRDGHHLQNRSGADAMVLEVGTRQPDEDEAFYPDIDLHAAKGRSGYFHRDGRPYPGRKPRNPATETTMTKSPAASTFVYVTYIRTTQDKVWHALTNQEFIRKYWFGVTAECDWKAGSPWKLILPDGRTADSGEIVEVDPPKRLVIKWRNEFMPEMNAEGYGTCVFDLEAVNGAVKLTITHSNDTSASKFIAAVSGGWPRILSNLKSLLETGELVFVDEPAA